MLVDRADFADLTELAAHRQRLWERQRTYVQSRSALHRRAWAGTPPPERLEGLPELPLIDKEMLRRSQRTQPPFGDYLAAEETAIARLHRTSGTTGTAMNLALSREDAHETAIVGARAQAASGQDKKPIDPSLVPKLSESKLHDLMWNLDVKQSQNPTGDDELSKI